MSGQQVVSDQWSIQVYTVQEATYETLDLRDMVRSQWIVSHVVRGDVVTSCGGESAVVRAGDVMIHPPDMPFSERAAGPGMHHWLAFDVRNADGVDLFKQHPVTQVVALRDPRRFTAAFLELLRAFEAEHRALGSFMIAGHVMRVLGILLEDAYGAAPQSARAMWTVDERFVDVMRCMETRMHEKLTRADLAAILHQSPNYFDKRFRQSYGVTAMDMLRDMRLRKARQLLEQTTGTLEHIAMACGLGDAAYMSRLFVRRYGMSPGACRKQARTAQAVYWPEAARKEGRA